MPVIRVTGSLCLHIYCLIQKTIITVQEHDKHTFEKFKTELPQFMNQKLEWFRSERINAICY
jgi:hypothetical protein